VSDQNRSVAEYINWMRERYGPGHRMDVSTYSNTDMFEAFNAGRKSKLDSLSSSMPAAAYQEFSAEYWPNGDYTQAHSISGRDFSSFFSAGYLAALGRFTGKFDDWYKELIRGGIPEIPDSVVGFDAWSERVLRLAFHAGASAALDNAGSSFEEWATGVLTSKNVSRQELRELLHFAFDSGVASMTAAADRDLPEELREAERVHSELVNELLEGAPSTYDADEAAEAIVLRYVRDLEEMRDSLVDSMPVAIYKVLSDPNFNAEPLYQAQARIALDRRPDTRLPGIPYIENIQLPPDDSADTSNGEEADKGAESAAQ
jgi:hypothetical protein